MKTLNLNKLTILLGLFLVSAFFTTGANALCTVNADGEIITPASATGQKVSDDTTSYDEEGEVDYQAGDATNDCTITPATYKIVFYKVGVCTADPDLNDLSSCEMFFEDAAGITVDIKAGVNSTFDIPEFTITPGTYPFLYVQLSNKLGMKWQGSMSNNVTGSSGTGKYCWTNNAGFHSMSPQVNPDPEEGDPTATVETAYGTSLAYNAVTVDCGTLAEANAGVIFNYEIITRFSQGFCSDNFLANGDKEEMQDKEGVGASRGQPTISLLTTADVFATTCTNSAKIAWTTTLDTAYTITENSSFEMSIAATAANEIQFDGGTNLEIFKVGSGAPKISLNVTD
jgi:hypothetical protein